MANEFKHASVGTSLSQAEWEAVGGHVFNSQATGDIVYASSSSQLSRLAKGTDTHVLILSSGIPAWSTSTGITAVGTIATGVWQGTDVGVAYGGTGVSTLTDGGILLGSGASAITAMAVLADSEMIVGNGSTDPVAESGATLRTSIGVGTGDSPTFTGLTLSGDLAVNGTDITSTGALTINPTTTLAHTLTANQSQAFTTSDGTTTLTYIDTRNTTPAIATHAVDSPNVTLADAANATHQLFEFGAYDVTLAGTTTVSSSQRTVNIESTQLRETGGAVTVTEAITMRIAGAPYPFADVTITNPYAFVVDSGKSRFDGDITIDGDLEFTGTQEITGTGNITLNPAGALILQTDSSSWNAFQLQNPAGHVVLGIDTRTAVDNVLVMITPPATSDTAVSGTKRATLELAPSTLTLAGSTGVTSLETGLVVRQTTITDTSALTVAASSTVYIAGAPIEAGSVSITNPYALWVDAGVSRFDGAIIGSGGQLDIGQSGVNMDVKFYGLTSPRDMHWDAGANALWLLDDTRFNIGDSADIQMYHDPDVSYITGNNHPLNVDLNGGTLSNVGPIFQRVATAAGAERAIIHKDGIADNTATAIFTITTVNESGNNDDGAYTCFIKGMVGHRIDTDAAGHLAVKGYSVAFARCIAGDSDGTNTAVTEIWESAEAGSNLGNRGINSVTTTVTETSEYVQTINITIDDDGSGVDTFEVVFEVEVIWGEFQTPPVITAS